MLLQADDHLAAKLNEIVTAPDLAALAGPVPFTDTEWAQAVDTARARLEQEAADERAFESRFA